MISPHALLSLPKPFSIGSAPLFQDAHLIPHLPCLEHFNAPHPDRAEMKILPRGLMGPCMISPQHPQRLCPLGLCVWVHWPSPYPSSVQDFFPLQGLILTSLGEELHSFFQPQLRCPFLQEAFSGCTLSPICTSVCHKLASIELSPVIIKELLVWKPWESRDDHV